MYEKLLALAILAHEELIGVSQFTEKLDEYFFDDPTNNLLLSLEFEYNDTNSIIATLLNQYELIDFNLFGLNLFREIDLIYNSSNLDIKKFGEKMYLIWKNIPYPYDEKEPFYTLSYADDCLSYGDEKQTRELYEQVISFYKSK